MTAFSDADLRRLKEVVTEHGMAVSIDISSMKALLFRLEAAERWASYRYPQNPDEQKDYDAWCSSKGNENDFISGWSICLRYACSLFHFRDEK